MDKNLNRNFFEVGQGFVGGISTEGYSWRDRDVLEIWIKHYCYQLAVLYVED